MSKPTIDLDECQAHPLWDEFVRLLIEEKLWKPGHNFHDDPQGKRWGDQWRWFLKGVGAYKRVLEYF